MSDLIRFYGLILNIHWRQTKKSKRQPRSLNHYSIKLKHTEMKKRNRDANRQQTESCVLPTKRTNKNNKPTVSLVVVLCFPRSLLKNDHFHFSTEMNARTMNKEHVHDNLSYTLQELDLSFGISFLCKEWYFYFPPKLLQNMKIWETKNSMLRILKMLPPGTHPFCLSKDF